MIRYWNRLLNMDVNRLTHKIFLWDWNLSINNNNWCSDIRGIFNKANMLSYFENNQNCDLEQMASTLKELDFNIWQDEITNKPKLRTYIGFKDIIETEHYVRSFMPKHQRSVFSKFRCGILPLHIETGRYSGLAVEDRICEFCTSNEVEDELHFLCSCSLYDDLRSSMYNTIQAKSPDFIGLDDKHKFHFLIQKEQQSTSKFIWKAFCRRRSIMYNS